MSVMLKVGMADGKVSSKREDVLITYALGSCLGITVYDPIAHVGGLLHAMQPASSFNPRKAAQNPYAYVDTGVNAVLRECYRLGAEKRRMIVKVAGGASSRTREQGDYFQVGKKNFEALQALLEAMDMRLKSYDVGGNQPRTMLLIMETGDTQLEINGLIRVL